MKKLYALLFAICMFLLAIYSAVMCTISDGYFFIVLVIAFPVIGLLILLIAFRPKKKK